MSVTLITGADGHVGNAVARWLLDHGENDLALFVRADSDAECAEKKEQLGDLANHKRCTVVCGNLRSSNPFADIAADTIVDIVHSAAVTNFAVERDTAEAVNVEGTRKLLDFAATCPDLRRFGLVSSLYAVGLRSGSVDEEKLDNSAPFANHYEWSKWNAESLLFEYSDIPWQIYRVSTIIGEDEDGVVVQQNVIHNTLRLLYYGLLSVIPGQADTRVYTVTSKFAASAIGRLFLEANDNEVFHLSDSGDDAITLKAMTDLVYEVFMEEPRFAKQRILKPLFCDQESFDTLVEGTSLFGGAVAQALDSVAPFAPQLYSDKDVRTTRTTAALGGLKTTDSRKLLRAVSEYLVETRWGLK